MQTWEIKIDNCITMIFVKKSVFSQRKKLQDKKV